MAAHLVQYQDGAIVFAMAVDRLQSLVQKLHHQLVQAFTVFAPAFNQGFARHLVSLCMRDAIADIFAACLVVQPVHVQPCGVQNVEQIFIFKLA